MDRQQILEELRGMMSDYLEGQGLDLVDLIYRYEGRDLVLRILVDKPEGGISLDECSALNSKISRILDEKDILKEKYILEVSSPGVDRPLLTKRDFIRCINKKARFFLNGPINGKMEWEGLIAKVGDEVVYVQIQNEVIEIPLKNIRKAKQIIDVS